MITPVGPHLSNGIRWGNFNTMPKLGGGSNRRRSDRISVSLPIQVRGADPKDKQVNEPSKTVEVGRTGTKFSLKAELRPNQKIKIGNIRRSTEANFRVVGKVSGPDSKLIYWGAECLDSSANFWGITFPPPEEGDEAAGRILLECGSCKAQELSYLSDLETEVFSLTTRVVRECKPCVDWTEWFKPETEAGAPATGAGAAGSGKAEGAASPTSKPKSNRASRRLSLKMSACILTREGGEEVVKTINISKGGLAILSRVEYPKDAMLKVAFPYNEGGGNIFILSQVVRVSPGEKKGTFIIGIQYLR